jgi:hypothetical protein
MSGQLQTQKLDKSTTNSSASGFSKFLDKNRKPLVSQPPLIQTKLTINQPGDKYEQEADRIAEEVMRMPDPVPQRKCINCDEDEEEVLQAKRSTGQVTATQDQDMTPLVQKVLRSPGQPLDNDTREFMESRFEYDFSKVRVHANTQASESAMALNARAYTVRQNIVFKEGEYKPRMAKGRELLAHELVHVMQQASAPVTNPLYTADVRNASEHEATTIAVQAISTGQKAVPVQLHTPARIARQTGNAPVQSAPKSVKPSHVNLIRVSCESNTIEFETDVGVYIYNLTECDIKDADYIATVTVEGNNVNFSPPPDSPQANARFPYRIEAGQPNPSTFLQGQTTVRIVTGTLSPPVTTPTATVSSPFKVCARALQISPYGNHAYIEAPPFRYAIISPTCPARWYENPLTGTGGQKWDNSPDPCGKKPTCLDCIPAPGVTDVGKCLRSAFTAYNNPSLYKLLGPNSNTFAGTLARACCAGMVPKPAALGWVPGWDDAPAPAHPTPAKGCPPGPKC